MQDTGQYLLDKPIEFLKGVGPQRSEVLKKELGIFTWLDLLQHFPFRYVDKSRIYTIREIIPGTQYIQLNGIIQKVDLIKKGRVKRLTALFADETGTIELVWFKGIQWIAKILKPNQRYTIFGKPTYYNGKLNMAHPELDFDTPENPAGAMPLEPVYPATEKLKSKGLDSRGIMKIMQNLVKQLSPPQLPENLPPWVIEQQHLSPRFEALMNIHFPENEQMLKLAQFRLKFEELFFVQLLLLQQKSLRHKRFKGLRFPEIGDLFNRFYKEQLDFPLTGAQKRVLKEIRKDLNSGKQMNRLLQGDVGSGKTVVALMCMLMAIDNQFQAAIMVPTEILAQQHDQSIREAVQELGLITALLTSSVKGKKRKEILAALMAGEIHLLIGTHALIEEEVRFKNLGIVIIDEQHRFGVAQRARLWKKNIQPPHVLVMTATPIPRTLAMTLYGDLDVSVIDEMPPGRKPVQTVHRTDSSRIRVFGFLKEQIGLGRQVYIVYPLIRESEKLDYKDLLDGYESIVREFPLPQYKVSIVHGKMKSEDKEFEMQRFIRGETHIMVATTVIEVGVNVPNASVMVIESAERFGLSQLHQLRGRVGRGADQSFCILMTGYKLSAEGKQRIRTMVETTDGFEIAEADLRLRGPGDMEGTRQSGLLDLKIADLGKDQQILQLARDIAVKLLEEDPELEQSRHRALKAYLSSKSRHQFNWSRIS